MKTVYVKIVGIHCKHCETKIILELLKNKKIKEVKIIKNIAHITYCGSLKKEEIIRAICGIDYFTKEEYISWDLKEIDTNLTLKEFLMIFIVIILLIFFLRFCFGFNIFNMIPTIDSNITYGMLVITGVFTSIHCISMCGAINLVAIVNKSDKLSVKKPFLYNLGRVISYTLIGGIVGLIGSVISLNETVRGMIIIIAALIMFCMALKMLGLIQFRLPLVFPFRFKVKSANPFVIGLFNGLMPCGPLQAMQIYALSTGSFFSGALAMFLFGIGTVPLMFFLGVVFSVVKGKKKILLNKIASILILILSFVMFNRGLLSFNIDLTKPFQRYQDFTSSIIKDNYQEVEIDLSYDNYGDIVIYKDIPVKMIIHVDKKNLTGCNEEIIISEFGIRQKLEVGDNVIEFIPTKLGTFTMTCWMNMISNTIQVIDDENYFKHSSSLICSYDDAC